MGSASPAELQSLMERIRERAGQIASWSDLIKAAKINMMEKVNHIEAEDREQLRESLEILQRNQKMTTAKEVFDQLRDLAVNKCGLKFVSSNPTSCFLTTDIFYVEIKAAKEDSPVLEEVHVVHGNLKPEEATLLKQLINDSRWLETVEQLRALNRYYPDDRNGKIDTPRKQETFKSLMFLEKDLWSLQPNVDEVKMENLNKFLELPLGAIRQREAGQPMQISYFLSPYDFLDVNENRAVMLSIPDIVEKKLGASAEIVVENCPSGCLLPTKSLRQKSKPGFFDLSAETSNSLPATFVLDLKTPLFLLKEELDEIRNHKRDESVREKEEGNLLRWIIDEKQCSKEAAKRGLIVTLKEQRHSYIIDSSAHRRLVAEKVYKIPFSHPNQLISIVKILRKQSVINSVIGSCVRERIVSQTGFDGAQAEPDLKFQLSFPCADVAECIFEYPMKEGTILNARFQYSNWKEMSVELSVITGSLSADVNFKKVASKLTAVFQKCWSIPVTMRSLMIQLGWVQKDPKEPMETDEDFDEIKLGRSLGDGDNRFGSWRKDLSDTDKFFLFSGSNSTSGSSGGKISSAWCPNLNSTLYSNRINRSAQTDKVNYSFEPFGDPRNPPNLLDLFKEIDTVDELIPPKRDQSPLKSPTLIPVTPQSTKLQEMLGSPAIGSFPLPPPSQASSTSGSLMTNPSMTISRTVSRGRHLSSSSDTFGELESILQMSKSLTSEQQHQQMGMSGPPGTEQSNFTAASMAADLAMRQMKRSSSGFDAADHTMSESGPFSPNGSRGVPSPAISSTEGSPMVPPAGPSSSPLAQTASTPSSIFPPTPNKFMHSRSFEMGMLPPNIQGQQPFPSPFSVGPKPMNPAASARGIDEFDFEKSDPIEAGLFKYRHMADLADSGAMSASPYFAGGGSQNAFSFGVLPTSGPGSRGGKVRGGRGRGRGSKKSPGNLGERQMSLDTGVPAVAPLKKPRGGSGLRRPRKQRGGVTGTVPPNAVPMAQLMANDMSQMGAGMKMHQNFPESIPNLLPAATSSSIFPEMPPVALDSNYGKLGSNFPDPFSNQPVTNQTVFDQTVSNQPPFSLPTNTAASAPAAPTPEKSKGHTEIGLEIEDSDDSDSQSGDMHLRKQIQDVLSGGPKPSPKIATPPVKLSAKEEKAVLPESGNLFENMQSHAEIVKSSAPKTNPMIPSSSLPPSAPAAPRPKPNILVKTAGRKGSLDMVIGKLRDKVGQGAEDDEEDSSDSMASRKIRSATIAGEMTDPLVDSVFGAYTPAELAAQGFEQLQAEIKKQSDAVNSGSELSGPSSSSPADPEGIKVVIKKNLIRQTQEKMAMGGSTFKHGLAKQKPNESKSSKVKDELRAKVREKKKREDKFGSLKTEAAAKKRKIEEGSKTGSKVEKQLMSPGAKAPKLQLQQELPAQQSATDPKFPGSEGIFFSKSLKGFKIPKLQEEIAAAAPPIVPQPQPLPSLPKMQQDAPPPKQFQQSTQRKTSTEMPQQPSIPLLQMGNTRFPPKSILKQASKPPTLQPEVLTNFRPMGRKTLLPKPEDVNDPLFAEALGIRHEVFDNPAEPVPESLQIRSPDPDTGFNEEDTKSPTGLNISKDSDMSPELKIADEVMESADG